MMALKVVFAALARPPSSWCASRNNYGNNVYDDAGYPYRDDGRDGSRVRDGVAVHNAMKIQDRRREVNQSN